MERPVIFLQFLLVLVMAIRVIYSCGCASPRTMEESICAGEALVMATPLRMLKVNGAGNYVDDIKLTLFFKYEMYVNIMYHDGPNDLDESHNITVYSPKYCHTTFELGHEYVLAGLSDGETSLIVTCCDYIERVDWDLHHDEHEKKNDFLTRQQDVKCKT